MNGVAFCLVGIPPHSDTEVSPRRSAVSRTLLPSLALFSHSLLLRLIVVARRQEANWHHVTHANVFLSALHLLFKGALC